MASHRIAAEAHGAAVDASSLSEETGACGLHPLDTRVASPGADVGQSRRKCIILLFRLGVGL